MGNTELEKLFPKVMGDRYRPYVGLLTSESINHDVEPNPRLIAPDPFASDAYLDAFSPDHHLLLTEIEDKNIMNSEDEPSSGLNARLRPRKSTVPSPQASKALRRPESKSSLDRPKRTSTPSKATRTKSDDLANKSDLSTAPQLLCPFCDRKFASKQTVSKHVRRTHLSNPNNGCLFCSHAEADPNKILRHMVDTHPTQYFACLDCKTRFSATSEIAEHKTNVCEKQKEKPYRSKLRQKVSSSAKKSQKALVSAERDLHLGKDFPDGQCFNGIVISCELKPSQVRDEADIEDNITTNLILPPSKNLGNNAVIEKNAVIVLDDIQWNKRMPANFSFHNTDADQILSRLGVVHRSPRTGESTKKDWFKNAEDLVQKFEKCFDTSFYSKVASNVNENLTKFLDGSFNFNPDPDSVIKTRKSKYSVVINTAEGFPILLAFEQYSRNIFDGYIPRTLAPKHKWKWENDKNPLNPDDIKRDTHVNKCIITLVSSLDIWTQLCMRQKFEQKFRIPPLEKKTEKQNTISRELKEILESRELPKPSSQQVVKYVPKPTPVGERLDFPASLGLKPTAPAYDLQPAVLSGEWVRPRCYVCCACGAQTRDSRALSTHISSQHPNAQVQHYEIVGELLLNADILKHLYVPPSQMWNRTRPLRGFRECTKCKKSISLEDLHQHMLDCAGDTPAVRRKVRYRPFGVRRRRTRLPDNTIRKKIRKDIRSRQSRQKAHMRQRPKIRSEVGDAETIRKMLADLPAKRHRVVVNPLNPSSRPRRKLDIQRNKLIIKRRSSEIAQKRKQRELKNHDNLDPTVSKNGNNKDNDIKSNKSDDENKPLRPKIKRVITHGPRGTETLKRKVALSRAKKRAKLKEKEAVDENKEQPPGDATGSGSGSSGKRGDQSTDNPPRRIDVNERPCGERKKSDRDRSDSGSNHDHQSPGSSGSENGNINNSFGPDQNTPLKHSIARLTSETELHESPLQYHHLFLTQQQECAEVDVPQHLPTGQPPLFENEAVVTKLDKPPLHFDTREPLDPYSLNRNKPIKPKKGLNDCIAMLKNKLSDPISTEIVPHPVPCGSGDSLGGVTTAFDRRSATSDDQTNMNSRPAEISYRHPDGLIDHVNRNNIIAQNFANLPFHYLPNPRAFDNSNALGGNPPPDNRIELRYTQLPVQMQNEGVNKKEPTRRRSTRGERDTLKQADFVPKTSSFNYPVTTPPMVTPTKANPRPRRRSASQIVAVNHNAASDPWKPTGPYNQTNTPRMHPSPTYSTDAILAARAYEYHAQRMPEALMNINPAGAYAQAQNMLKHQQMVAEQIMAEAYKQKLAMDKIYTDQKLTPPPIENMFVNSKQATLSPGSIYAGSLQAISPRSMYSNNHLALQSPGNMYLHNTNISPGGTFANSMPMATSPRGMPAESMPITTSPASIHANILNAGVSPDNLVPTCSKAIVIHNNINDHSQQISISPRSTGAKIQHAALNPIITHANMNFSASPESAYVNSKQAIINLDNIYSQSKQSTVSPSAIDVNSKQAEINLENLLANTKKVAESSGLPYSKSNLIAESSESLHFNNEPADISPKTINAAVSPRSTYSQNNLIAVSSESLNSNSEQVSICPHTENVAEIPGPSYPKSNLNPVSFESLYIKSKEADLSPYIENAAVSPGPTYSKSNLTAVSPVSLYVNSERAAISPSSKSGLALVSPGSTYENCKQAAPSPERDTIPLDVNTNNKRPSTSPGISHPGNSRQPATNVKCIYANQENTNVSIPASGSNYISKKQAAAAADHQSKLGGTAAEPHYINKKQAASLENNHNKKHTIPSQESIHENNAYAVITAENNLLGIAKNACTESSYINKKVQAMTGKNNLPDKTIKLPTTESNLISRTPTTLLGEHIIKQTQAMIQSEREFYNTIPDVECKNSVTISIPREPNISIQTMAAIESEIKETIDDKKQPSENKNLLVISGSEVLSQQEIACSKRNMINEHLPNALVGRDKNMYKHCHDKKFQSSLPGIPSAFGAMTMIYQQGTNDMEPLDLTKSNAEESVKTSKENDDTSKPEHYSGYETLDLSRQGSQNLIVDLRVKINSPEHDISSEPRTMSNRNRVSSTDFSTKSPNIYNILPNLSVKTKNQSDGYEFPVGRCTDCKDTAHIPGLLVKPRDCHISVSPKGTLPNILSDPSERVDKQEVLSSMSAKMSGESIDSHELLKNSINSQSVQDDDLTSKINNQDQSNATYALHKQPGSLLMLEPSLEEKTQTGDNSLSNDRQPVRGKPSYDKSASYDDSASTAPDPMPIKTSGMSAADERIKLLNNSNNQIPVSNNTVNLEKSAFPNASAIPTENAATVSTIVIPPVLSQYENTKPVYTLVNACTSLAKIEPSNVAPTTDSILSIPGATSANAAPEYTLTDITINPLLEYKHIYGIPAQDKPSYVASTTCKTQVNDKHDAFEKQSKCFVPSTSIEATDSTKENMSVATNVAFDSETAKKIAMLPKELVEILGTMPLDHRNQLLNVLPQYVSTSATTRGENQNASANNNTSVVSRGVSPARNLDFDVKPSLSLEEEVNKYETPDQIPKVYEIDRNTVIDLTEDDVTPRDDVIKASEEIHNSSIKTCSEPVPIIPTTKPCKQKVNDQTASLRAVRIKAPSERNKSLSIDNTTFKKSGGELKLKANVEPPQEQDDSSDLDKTLAIQQAEISSTQHNTAIAGNCKYPLAISPSSTEYSGDESNKHVSQQSPVPVTQIVANTEAEMKYLKPLPKPGKVSSSISTNKINLKNYDKNLNNNVDICSPKNAVKDNEMSKETEISSGKKSLDIITSDNLIKTIPPKTADHEEDSDDDITLATIVKQKQDHVKVSKNLNYKPRTLKATNKKKIKKRKGKKCDKTGIKHLESAKASDVLKIDQPNDVILTHLENFSVDKGGDQEMHKKIEMTAKTLSQNDTIKHSKKRPKKGQLVTDTLDFVNKRGHKPQMVENIQYTQSEVTAERINIELNLKDLVPTALENQKIQKKVVTADDDTKLSINKTKRLIDEDNVRINDFDDQMPSSLVTTIEVRLQVKENRDSLVVTDMEKRGDEKYISLAESPNKSDDVSTSMAQSSLNKTEPLARDDIENDLGYENSKKGEKLIHFKKKINDKMHNNDLMAESLDNISQAVEATDTATTLRRSRRGKSVFLDSPILEPETIALREITIEQKTPLTKKQRIFSKLLLDKECSYPSAHTTPEKEDFITREPIKSTDTKTVDTTPISDIENIDDTLADKRKGTKRRIDGELAKKTKKKKSLEDQNTNNEIIHAKDPPKSELSPENFDVISEANKDVRDFTVTTAVKKDLVTGLRQSMDVNSTDKNGIEKNVASTEKRKIINQVSLELSQSSKPKKIKTSKSDKKVEIGPVDDIANKDEIVSTLDKSLSSLTPEAKTACYNLPLPSRRARSKSVVVKSSSYDPYDIDLEDMIEQSETFKVKENNSDYVNKSIKKNKLGNITNKDDVKILREERKDSLVKDESSENQFSNKKLKNDKTIVSDSDDSSKSDIPLQKYVEEKEKRIAEIQAKMEKARELKAKENDQNKAKKETSPTTEKLSTEEELRSEQFMESFGFFSERKPRKSNLLATKKISETFHITNVSDDSFFGFKERSNKKSLSTDTKKSTDMAKAQSQPSTSKKVAAKRGRRKKTTTIIMPCYCELCKKEFRRSDNILRHQMTFQHVSKVCEIEMKIKPRPNPDQPPPDEPNHEIAYKQYLDRFNILTDLLAVKKKNNPKAAAKIVVPTLDEILADVYKAIRAQKRSVLDLSGDEALFLECCELLRGPKKKSVLDTFEKALNEITTDDKKCDNSNFDSITAKNILSEEDRNLKNHLISGLKEAETRIAKLKHQGSVNTLDSSKTFREEQIVKMNEVAATDPTFNENQEAHKSRDIPETHPEDFSDQFSSPNAADSQYEQIEEFETPPKSRPVREKKNYEIKEKMYPDLLIEDIDMFEDKFDKIKRKCRSQAAAAKQPQPVVEQAPSCKGRKKTEKKKGKRNSKKTSHPSAQVPTKGALKGFDGIKVSIPTSDINLSAIVPVPEISSKKKKKSSAKKKRDSESSGRNDSDELAKDSSTIQKQVDVYEFMDSEDAELFELRPSTLMERFKSISNNKETPRTSKFHPPIEEATSQGSASDGDDFVYMSDDYVCSDDETENSLLSCELGNGKVGSDLKKISMQKRKDVVEKNAVMGKIFKHNAVRAEKKIVVPKDPEPSKANLDQLFDSLLEDEPNSSTLNSEAVSSHDECSSPPRKENQLKGKHSSNSHNIQTSSEDSFTHPSKSYSSVPNKSVAIACPSSSKRRNSSPARDNKTPPRPEATSSKKYDLLTVDYGPSTSTKYDSVLEPADYGPSTSKKYDNFLPKFSKKPSLKNYKPDFTTTNDENIFKSDETKPKKRNDSYSSKHVDEAFDSYDDEVKSPTGKPDEGISTSYDYSADVYDHSMLDDKTGVARQRARRKCTVGKQNVLAETWSSESEPDSVVHRPNSAESDVAKKKKGRKREGQQASGRRGINRPIALKKQDIESRVTGRILSSMTSGAGGSGSRDLVDDPGEGPSGLCGVGAAAEEGRAAAGAACAAMPAHAPAAAGPSGGGAAGKGRPRALTSYWSAEGDEEPEHVQQHGWIVGDSHKKLVTMLAHAKGRKRNNDDKRHLIE